MFDSQALSHAIYVAVDTTEGSRSLRHFNREFRNTLKKMGKSTEEIDSLSQIAKEFADGKRSLDEFDDEFKELIENYKAFREVARASESLKLRPHEDIKRQIKATRDSIAELKKAKKLGVITGEEFSQAALRAQKRIIDLKRDTNGWMDALSEARGEILAMGASTAALGSIVNQAISFEDAFADVKKTVSGTDDELSSLADRIVEMSTEMPIAAEGLAAIAAAGGQMGVELKSLDRFVELTAKISTAFDILPEQAGESVAKLANVFGLPIEGVEALADSINVLGNTTAAKEKDIVQFLTRAGGTARQFKLTAEQVSALGASLIAMGKAPEVAATGVNALLSKLQTAEIQGGKFQQALADMGYSAEELAASIRDNPQQALTDFLRTLEGLEGQDRANALANLFGQEYQDDIALLVGGLDQYEAALGRATNAQAAAGAVNREFQQRIGTTSAQMEILLGSLKSVAITIGNALLPAFNGLVSIGVSAASALQSLVDVSPNLAALAVSIGTAAASVSGLSLVAGSARVVVSKAFAAMALNVKSLNASVNTAAASMGRLGAASNVLFAGMVGWEIGKYLREQFEWVEEAGVHMARTLTLVAEGVKYAWEAASAAFTDDTVEAATKRHEERLAQINAIYDDMAQNVSKNRAESKEFGEAGAEAGDKIAAAFSDAQKAMQDAAENGIGVLSRELGDAHKIVAGFSEELRATAKAAGIDLVGALTGIDDETRKAMAGLRSIADELADVQLEAALADKVLSEKLSATLATINSQSEIEALTHELQAMGEAGSLSADGLERALAAVDARARELARSLGDIRDAQLLGGQFQSAAEKVAGFSDGLRKVAEAAGIDLVEALSGVDGATQNAMRGLKNVATELAKSGATAAEVGQILDAQLVSVLQSIGSEVELDAVIAQLNAMADAGIISADRLRESIVFLRLEFQRLNGDAGGDADSGLNKAGDTYDKTARKAKKAGEEIQKTGDKAEESAVKITSAAATIASAVDAYTKMMYSLSQAAGERFKQLGLGARSVTEEADAAAAKINELRQGIQNMNIAALRSGDMTGVSAYLARLGESANRVGIEYWQQRQSLESLMKSYRDGVGTLSAFSKRAETTGRYLDLLSDEDLAGLNEALEQANERMQSLRDSTADTLAGLQDELDRLEGNTDAIRKRDYERQIAELREALAAAKKTGDRETIAAAQQSLELAKKIYATKSQQLKEEREERAARERERQQEQVARQADRQRREVAQAQAPVPVPQPADSGPRLAQVIRLEAGGRSVNIQADNVDTLLQVLADAGMRTI